jgi:hypothetical protein
MPINRVSADGHCRLNLQVTALVRRLPADGLESKSNLMQLKCNRKVMRLVQPRQESGRKRYACYTKVFYNFNRRHDFSHCYCATMVISALTQ